MKNKKSKKIIYAITSSAAVFVLGFGIILGTNRLNNNQVQNNNHYGISDLQDIMLQYGAVNASTMDGGTSTQMYYDGEVINTPYSPLGPRSCPTAFLIK